MLSRFDDYPVHQTPEPIAHPAASDRNVYDRYWFNGFADDGEFYYGVAMGRYPHRGVLDCGFSIVRDGVQHCFLASRRAPAEPDDTRVGPFRLEILEPMRRARLVLEPNETGIECELEFQARTACVEEGRQTLRRGARVYFDVTRFAQFGRWEGEVRWAGQSLRIDPARVRGTKDRSWGIRPVGEPETGGAPPTQLPQFYFVWAPLQWEDHCTHFGVFEDAAGGALHQDGALAPVYAGSEAIPGTEDPAIRRAASVEHRIAYRKGTRWARSAELALVEGDGTRHEIELEPLLRFQMKGIGYGHPEWAHGRWRGELAVGGDSWKLDELNPLAPDNLHVQQVMRARSGGAAGIGVMEQICIGPHAPSGFEQLLDGAR